MKVTLESTTKMVDIRVGGKLVPARIWEGQTESGIPVFAAITRIAPAVENPGPEIVEPFARELKDCRQTRIDAFRGPIDMRMIL